MADEVLATLVGVLGGGVLAANGWAAAYFFRSIHQLRDRMRDVEARMDTMRQVQDALDALGARQMRRAARKVARRSRDAK